MGFPGKRLGLWLTIGTGISLFTGVSLTGVPAAETVYNERTWQYCESDTCRRFFNITIGNTGWKEQRKVILRFEPGSLSLDTAPVIAIRSRAIGRRPFDVERGTDSDNIKFGPLPAGAWYELSVTATYQKDHAAPAPRLLDVEPAEGPAIHGSPELLRLGRVLYAVVALFF